MATLGGPGGPKNPPPKAAGNPADAEDAAFLLEDWDSDAEGSGGKRRAAPPSSGAESTSGRESESEDSDSELQVRPNVTKCVLSAGVTLQPRESPPM
eukprot:5624883-Pyramimonas_sp.AAC.1